MGRDKRVKETFCAYCCGNGEGHGRLKYSYDDEDGMSMSIHTSQKRENGYQSKVWWATVHFRGECRDFYIEFCPFCGRTLVPQREEYETCPPPQPRYKHKILVELWRNRPWKYIPAVVRFMREYPYTGGKNDHFSIWLRNALYLNWQVALKPTPPKGE